MSEEKETVTEETETEVTPAVEEAGATETKKEDDFDWGKLQAEYEASTQPKPPSPEQKPQIPELAQAFDSFKQEFKAELQDQQDITNLVSNLKKDLPSTVNNEWVRAYIQQKVQSDPVLENVWNDRHTKPRQFQAAQRKMAEELSSFMGNAIDPNATETREAVSHAVRGASNPAPESKPPNYGKLTDNEFQQELDKLGLA